jgi:hypothetical protein
MSFIAELQRMQQNIKELNQTFEALTESVDRYQNTRTPPEYPNELRERNTVDLADPKPRSSINDISPQEWDAVSKRFYREPKS